VLKRLVLSTKEDERLALIKEMKLEKYRKIKFD